MQQAPIRLSQTIWSAFRAAKPVHTSSLARFESLRATSLTLSRWPTPTGTHQPRCRFYSNGKSDVEKKVEDAKSRIHDSLDARADAVSEQASSPLKNEQEETIVHTNPEKSSIVYTSSKEAKAASQEAAKSISDPRSLPSRMSISQSEVRRRFTDFMDNFQSHIFVASKRLNDLTGYSGIEKLKQEIEKQENSVVEARKGVKESRTKYAETIATRSTTQREVNDLLHRKHTWSSSDLERFTSLYRSDHANEQAETAAQRRVADAEATYEEMSVKLARTILARYHEEQIWSDKIRQMSTWGTWGLMGLNVLLFIVFQIAIEPWRRRRLVKGFEEKVELALKEREKTEVIPQTQDVLQPNTAAAVTPAAGVHAVADAIVEQIVDAVVGSSDASSNSNTNTSQNSEVSSAQIPSIPKIEAAVETVTAAELSQDLKTPSSSLSPEPVETPSEPSIHSVSPSESPSDSPSSSISDTPLHETPDLSFPNPQRSKYNTYATFVSDKFATYEEVFLDLFNPSKYLVITHREYTTAVLEGAVAGGITVLAIVLLGFGRGR